MEFVFSVDDVFSYSVVDRLGIRPALGPTVREPLLGSYLVLVLLLVVRAFAGLEIDAAKWSGKRGKEELSLGKAWFCVLSVHISILPYSCLPR